MDILSQLKVFSGVAVSSGVASYAAAVQQVLTPDETLLPVGVVVGLFLVAIFSTAKIVRLVDSINSRLDAIEARMEEKKWKS
tara:strand:- start:1485 stop:1730 length:246 start_codon:yes stop_codon:yes gene_type:complete